MDTTQSNTKYRVVWKNIITIENVYRIGEWVDSFKEARSTYNDVTQTETIDATLQRKQNGGIQQSLIIGETTDDIVWVSAERRS